MHPDEIDECKMWLAGQLFWRWPDENWWWQIKFDKDLEKFFVKGHSEPTDHLWSRYQFEFWLTGEILVQRNINAVHRQIHTALRAAERAGALHV